MRIQCRWFALLAIAGCGRPPEADLAVFGRVWTGDSTRPFAAAVATRGDTIVAVGDSSAVSSLVGPRTRVLRNGAALVAPGLMDAHVHLLDGGFQLVSVNLRDADSPAEFVRRIAAFARTRPAGEWILGGDWDHERWPGAPLPRRDPVFVSGLDGHMGLANSLALEAAGLRKESPDITGGTIVRDPRTGVPTGVLKDDAMDPVYAVIPEPTASQVDTALQRAMQFVASKGVTAVASVNASWPQVAGLLRAERNGTLTLRVALYPPLADWRRVADSVARRGPGNDWIRLAGVKAFVDGSLGSATALLFAPYTDDPTTSGLLVTPESTLRTDIGLADSAGLQVAVHAIGDRANALILDIYDSVAKAHGTRDRRFRVEHAQHLRPQDIPRFAQLGVVASMQPYHAIDDGRWAAKRLGPRISESYVFRSLLDDHTHLAFGSDWTVAPIDPILGIYAAVTRRTLDGKNPDGWLPAQKISVEEALRAYTAGGAYSVFAEHSRGMIHPGYRADLVLLDRDLFTIPPDSIEAVQVRATIVGGRVVYSRIP